MMLDDPHNTSEEEEEEAFRDLSLSRRPRRRIHVVVVSSFENNSFRCVWTFASLFFSDGNKKRVYSMRIPPERKRGIRNENSRVLDAQKSFGSLSFERTRYKYYERLKECVHHEKKADVLV